MHRILAVLVAVAAFAPTGAHAATVSGTISIGHPTVDNGLSITQNLNPCDPDGEYQGFDAFWIATEGGTAVAMAITGGTASDADIYFFDAECEYVIGADIANGLIGEPESGPIPSTGAWMLVVGYLGADIGFEVTIT